MNGSSSTFTPNQLRAIHLISALCDDRMTAEEALELENLVCIEVVVRKLYVSMMHLHAGLHQYASVLGTVADSSGADSSGADSLGADSSSIESSIGSSIESSIKSAGEVQVEDQELASPGMSETMVLPAMSGSFDGFEDEIPQTLPLIDYTPRQDRPRRLYIIILSGIAAMLVFGVGILTYFQKSPQKTPEQVAVRQIPDHPAVVGVPLEVRPPAVANVDSTLNAVWDVSHRPPQDGAFAAGGILSINSGVVQVKMHRGGQVVVEGPAELEFVSETEISLHYGKLAATVPGGGMVIKCPTGWVTDLGTEFGVNVSRQGGTEVAVFKGRVSAALSSTATTQASKELAAGQAAMMSHTELSLNPEGAVKQRYICNLKNQGVTSLDVTDLISGGDGTTQNRGIAIDALTGFIGDRPPIITRTGDGKYHKVDGYPVVDGGFIPTNGPMVVDSAGDQYTFDRTTNQTYNYIWTGGKIPWPDQQGISTLIGGEDYSHPPHAIICMHSNNALTLDLNAVRRIYPDREPGQFHCRFANSYVNGWYGAAKMNPIATAIVLLDGKRVYEKARFSNQDGDFKLELPLSKNNRFLTLVCTDAGTEIDHDWILWADPKIELASPN